MAHSEAVWLARTAQEGFLRWKSQASRKIGEHLIVGAQKNWPLMPPEKKRLSSCKPARWLPLLLATNFASVCLCGEVVTAAKKSSLLMELGQVISHC